MESSAAALLASCRRRSLKEGSSQARATRRAPYLIPPLASIASTALRTSSPVTMPLPLSTCALPILQSFPTVLTRSRDVTDVRNGPNKSKINWTCCRLLATCSPHCRTSPGGLPFWRSLSSSRVCGTTRRVGPSHTSVNEEVRCFTS